ncbi:MAG: hypothetical protein LBQ56_07885 [Synergistaceae bacterium]|nr:hypothetical protein [Synergistaceae bacterium]
MKRLKIILLLLGAVFGSMYFLEQRYGSMRLRDIEIEPRNMLSDTIVWQSVPRAAEKFWPALLFMGRRFVRGVENFYPVQLKIRLTGWGSYKVTVSPLEVFLGVSWNSNLWLLSTNGRMWLANLPANVKVRGIRVPEKPVLAWDPSMALPIDPEEQRGDIYPSSLPLPRIRRWYEALDKIGWNDKIYCLLAKRIDGRPVVQILLGSDAGITGEIIVNEDPAGWASLAAALEDIYPGADRGIPSGLLVNATYAGMKFTVTSRDAR